jgi:amino acid adenylation domain-containing protein
LSAGDKIERIESSKISVEPISNRPRHFPLSYSQQRLWFLDQLEPHHPVYNICKAERIKGRLNIEALESSLATIVRRHAILRTSFPAVDGEPVQSIDVDVRISMPRVDLSRFSDAQKQNELERLIDHEARAEFDLARGPLLRASLLILAAEEFVWLFTVHQMVWDGWSFKVFYRELEVLYEVALSNKIPVLPELSLQYADYAVRQREEHREERLQSDLSFWRHRLAQSARQLLFPTDRARSSRQTYRGMRRPVVVDSLTKGLTELSRRQGTTLFMTLLAAFMTLLHRYSGQAEIVVGCPVANRYLPEIDNLIGSFVNTLVLNTTIVGNSSFTKLLSEVRSICLAAFAHQELPFERLVEELQPERNLNHNPIFQTFFAFQSTVSPSLSLPGLYAEPIEINTGTSKFDLTLSLAERERKLTGFFEYSTDLFDSSTIERMTDHFRRLLEGVVADPDHPIAMLPILSEVERHDLLVEWNDTEADYPRDKCIQKLFEEQVERTPNSIAVRFDGQQLTYRELNERSNQLAHHLQDLGVGLEKLVGICVERSVDMVVGLLGILKAGGAYVPLDPSYPKERLAFMIDDARLSVVVTQENLIDKTQHAALGTQHLHVCLDRDWPFIERRNIANPKTDVSSSNLAYIIYTSGSTGQPKGVQVSHRSVTNCLWSIRHHIGFAEKEIFLAVTTMSFDIAALELYLPLITGAKLVLASREKATDGTELLRRLTEYSATAMQATPSTWRLLLDAGWKGSREFKILCGGEALTQEVVEQLLTRGTLWNLYGPTETTIWSAIAKVEAGEGPVSIGRPIANTQIYILDSLLQPVPVGVHGELYIGGDGLAQGYVNRPELTAEKFIVSPFGDQPGARLYRTGDRARYRADGNIEFLGRVDNQIKIRGYRIELGEIEMTLNQHPAVKESVVVTGERDSLGEKQLVGYIVSTQDSVASLSDLRGFLREKLPDYMIPSLFVFLNALPLTSNGKIDRSNLPPPDDSRTTLDQGFVEPRTEIEELVAQSWREVLKLDKIGVYDNFFELGGHSLLATRVVARLRKNFSIDLPLRRIFEMPTIAGLARTVETVLRTGQEIERTPILPVSREKPVLPSIAQEPILSLDEWAPGVSVFNIPAAYRLKGTLDVVALEGSITCVVERHEALRTTFPMVNGQYVQFISPSVSSKLEIIDLGNLPDEDREDEARKLVREEAEQPFNLANGPLFRIRLLRLGDEDHLLLIIMHHIISDGWSMAVFFHDLAAFYDAFSNRCPPSLPELPIQYADFADWQRQALREKLMETQLVYWKKQLDGPLAPMEFPTSRTRVNELNFLTARKSVSITGDLFRSLKKASQREESTLFITLLTSLKILLYCYTGQEDVRVGILVANRNRRETENLIGHFANTLIVRTMLSGASSLRQVARQVRDKALDSYTHQDLPFEALVRELEDEKNLNRASLCQVLFSYQTASLHPVKLQGLTVGFVDETKNTGELNLTITTFDLILLLKERPDGLVGSLLYKADLFDEAAINRLLGHFHDILRRISSEPDRPVSELCSLVDRQH